MFGRGDQTYYASYLNTEIGLVDGGSQASTKKHQAIPYLLID